MDELIEIAKQTSKLLLDLPAENDLQGYNVSLIFPSKCQNEIAVPRISEQEARMIFAHKLLQKNILFAIEAPTIKKYNFSGGDQKRSARTDLLVYNQQGIRNVGIEFKAHNAPKESIAKDIEKLYKEPHNGMWFHVLKNINSGTLGSLFQKFSDCFETLPKEEKGEGTIVFVIVVIECELLLLTEIDKEDIRKGKSSNENSCCTVPAGSYRVERNEFTPTDEGQDFWQTWGIYDLEDGEWQRR